MWFHIKTSSESTGIIETSQHPESTRVLQHLSFGPSERVSCLGPLGGASRVGDDPKTFIIIRHRHH